MLGARQRMMPSSRCSLPTVAAPIDDASSRASVTAARASLVTHEPVVCLRLGLAVGKLHPREIAIAAVRGLARDADRARHVAEGLAGVERAGDLQALEGVQLLAQRGHRAQRGCRLARAYRVLDELPQAVGGTVHSFQGCLRGRKETPCGRPRRGAGPPMRILVTGARGKVGSAAVADLLDAGHDVTALDVGAPVFEAPEPGAPAYFQADLADAGDAFAAVRGHDAVIHSAAIPEPTRNPPHVVFRNNLMATFNVIEAAVRFGVAARGQRLQRDRAGLLLPRARRSCPTTRRSTRSTRSARRTRTRSPSTSASS